MHDRLNDAFFTDEPLLAHEEAQAQALARAAVELAKLDGVETRTFCGGHQLATLFQYAPALEWDE